jgi:membrane protein DedA with SNARE-associated domain
MSIQPLSGPLSHPAPVLDHYGYLAVGGFITPEDFSIPVPDETMLIAAAVYVGAGRLNIAVIGLIAILAAVVHDNIGYAVDFSAAARWCGDSASADAYQRAAGQA